MKIKRIVFGFLILSVLACNLVTQMVFPPTATPVPTASPTATVTFTPTPEPLLPAYIPPECAAVPLATIPADRAVQATPELNVPEVSQAEQLIILREIEDVIEAIYV